MPNRNFPDAPLSGDRLYGDRENLRRYRDHARDEHRRFGAQVEREQSDGLPFVDRLTESDRFDQDFTGEHPRGQRNHATEGGFAYATRRETIRPDEQARMDREARNHRGRGPKAERNDKRIYEDVCERLADHDRIDASEIEVSVQDGEVTLTGRLRSRNAKRLVTDVVDSVHGVKDVHNNIRVSDDQVWPPGSREQ